MKKDNVSLMDNLKMHKMVFMHGLESHNIRSFTPQLSKV